MYTSFQRRIRELIFMTDTSVLNMLRPNGTGDLTDCDNLANAGKKTIAKLIQEDALSLYPSTSGHLSLHPPCLLLSIPVQDSTMYLQDAYGGACEAMVTDGGSQSLIPFHLSPANFEQHCLQYSPIDNPIMQASMLIHEPPKGHRPYQNIEIRTDGFRNIQNGSNTAEEASFNGYSGLSGGF